MQGEGALAGSPTLFVRFGGCDYRCSWCDSLYAVLPAEVRGNARKLSVSEIAFEALYLLDGVPADGMWVTLSGGNPALMQFVDDAGDDDLVERLHKCGFRVSIETQGSVWRDWLIAVDHLTVSPKPPSSGMATVANVLRTASFLKKAYEQVPAHKRSLKVVVFDDEDYVFASGLFVSYADDWPLRFLSVGTDQDHLQDEYRLHAGIAERYRWLCEKVAVDPVMRDVRVMPQLHVIAWGAKRGV